MVHSMAELSSSAMMMTNSDASITAVETALMGRMTAMGVRITTKIRSSRNEGSCRTAAQKPSTAKRTDWMKFRKSRRLVSGGEMGSLTTAVQRTEAKWTNLN